MSTTPFTCDGSRKLLPPIGKRSPVAKHRRASDGWCCGTRSITKHRPVWAMTSCCARGSAKRPGLRSNGSLKSEGAAMASYCQPRGHSGVRSMRKPAGQSACRSEVREQFSVEFVARVFPPLPAARERIKMRVRLVAARPSRMNPHPSPLAPKEANLLGLHASLCLGLDAERWASNLAR